MLLSQSKIDIRGSVYELYAKIYSIRLLHMILRYEYVFFFMCFLESYLQVFSATYHSISLR